MFFGLCYSSAWLTGAVCLLHLMYKFTRKYTYVKVNCWFCNINSKVQFEKKADWYCPHCQQFNGFKKDGDYSKPIPEQYNENLNPKCVTFSVLSKNSILNANGLCRICNANQELKIRQLALYVPLKEEDYDQEIEAFKQKLEKSYKLCSVCEKTLQTTLKLKSGLFQSKKSFETSENVTGRPHSLQRTYANWKFVFTFTFLILIMALVWLFYFTNLIVERRTNILKSYVGVLHSLKHLNFGIEYDNILNILLATNMALFIKSILRGAKFFGPVLFGIIVFMICDLLAPVLKIISIFAVLLYYVIKHFKTRKQKRIYLKQLSSKLKNIAEDIEDDVFIPEERTFCSNNVLTKNPLCGKFSDLTLGQSQKSALIQKNTSYLFKTARPLIQPSRLKLDDSENISDTPRSSPTISSGYDSVASFLQRSSDSISEFDSISQVSNKYRGISPTHSKWTTDNILLNGVSPIKGNVRNICGQSGQLSPYYRDNMPYFVNSDRFYGVSPVSPPSQSTSPSQSFQVQVNSWCSTIQIILCSVAFFILGFSFQIFVNKIKF